MQTSSDLVWRAVRRNNPERLPRDYWILPAAETTHGESLKALMREYPMDFARVGYHAPYGDDGRFKPGRWRDDWGALWENHQEGIMGIVVEHPIADWSGLARWNPPFADVEKGFDKAGEELRAAGSLFKQGGDLTLFHRMCWLRPEASLYMDLLEDPPELRDFMERVIDYHSRRLDVWLRYDYESLIIYDDWGSQTNMLIDPDIWRAMFKPVYADWCARIRKTGRLVFFHTDGWVTPIIEDLIEIGVDSLNCQLAVMGEQDLAARYAGRICFWGEIDRQIVLPRGTPDEVRARTRKVMDLFAAPEGGLIAEFEIGMDVPPPNFRAAVETFVAWP